MNRKRILIEVSNHHAHLSREDIENLFGKGYKLRWIRNLSQPGQFVSAERVHLISKGKIENVRVLGPEREESQIEILKSDVDVLGLEEVPIRMSGDLESSPGVRVIGPLGQVDLKKGVIISQRHLHVSDKEADELGIRDCEKVGIRINSKRDFILNNVFVRVGPEHCLALHIDKDDAEIAGINKISYGELV